VLQQTGQTTQRSTLLRAALHHQAWSAATGLILNLKRSHNSITVSRASEALCVLPTSQGGWNCSAARHSTDRLHPPQAATAARAGQCKTLCWQSWEAGMLPTAAADCLQICIMMTLTAKSY